MSRLRFFIWIFIKTFLGGILCYLDFLVLVSKWPLKKHCGVDSTYVYYVFLFLLLIILLWYIRHKIQGKRILKPFNFRWVIGFGRIFSGSMNEEPIMSTFKIFLAPSGALGVTLSVCLFVRLFSTKLSKALNLHLSLMGLS